VSRIDETCAAPAATSQTQKSRPTVENRTLRNQHLKLNEGRKCCGATLGRTELLACVEERAADCSIPESGLVHTRKQMVDDLRVGVWGAEDKSEMSRCWSKALT
jgi:hypothetical protein